MSFAEDEGYYDHEEPERIGSLLVVEEGYVKEVKYCLNCKSTDIRISKKGNDYCGKICWENPKPILNRKI